MAQPTLPTDKTVRIPVKLVTTAGDELPFKGFVLIPEERLVKLEALALAAQDLVTRNREAAGDVRKAVKVEPAVKALDVAVGELQKVWDIPK